MKKSYDVTCAVNCKDCFTRKFTEEEILELVYRSMPEDIYENIVDNLVEISNDELGDFTEEEFVRMAKIDWDGFWGNPDSMIGQPSQEDVTIFVSFTIDFDQFIK